MSTKTATTREYNYLYSEDRSGTIYYRLKMQHTDEETSYSKTVSVEIVVHETRILSVYPNPATDHVIISMITDQSYKGAIRIYDLSGKLVKTQHAAFEKGEHRIRLDVSELAAGSYILSVEGDTGAESTFKLSVE